VILIQTDLSYLILQEIIHTCVTYSEQEPFGCTVCSKHLVTLLSAAEFAVETNRYMSDNLFSLSHYTSVDKPYACW